MKSSLNQRLDAQIELLSVRGAETEEMIVTLASEDAFSKAGLERPLLLTQLRFSVQNDLRGKPYIQVSSQKAVVEPFLNFLIEIDWPRGRLVREYTLLLDPPVFMTQPRSQMGVVSARVEPDSMARPAPAIPAPIRRPQAASPVVERESNQAQDPRRGTLFDRRKSLADRMERQRRARAAAAGERSVDNAATERRSVPSTMASVPLAKESRSRVNPVESETASDYGPVRRHETLWKIASGSRSSNVSVQQMMLAILRYNPHAFIDDNINFLRRGVVLRIPDADEARSLTAGEAIAQVGEHNTLWRALASQGRTKVATVRKPAKKIPTPIKVAPKDVVKEPAVVAEKSLFKDRLSIQAPDKNTAVEKSDDRTQIADKEQAQKSGVSTTVRFAKEELTSEKLRNRELRSQVAELEKTASKMDQLVSVQESELAEFQARLKRLREEREAAEAAKENVIEPVVVAEVTPEPVVIERQETPVTEQVEEDLLPSEPSVPMGNEEPIVVKEEPLPELTAEELQASKTLPNLLNAEPEDGVFDGLLKRPQLLMWIGGGALLLLLAVWMVRRKKMAEESDVDAADLNQSQPVSDADDANADGEIGAEDEEPNFDEGHGETQVLDQDQMEDVTREAREARVQNEQEDSSDSLEALEDELPKDDTIAEADVYLAYGLYPQAEDLLKAALRDKPDRQEYQEKLLETYFASKNIPAFEESAASFKESLGDDNNSLWERVVVMGKELCPRNELFAGEISTDVQAADLAPVKPENADFELDETDIADVSGLDFRLEESLAGEELNLDIPADDLNGLDDDLGDASLNDDSLLEGLDDTQLNDDVLLASMDKDPLSLEEDALLDASIGDGLELDMSALELDDMGLTSDDLPMIPELEEKNVESESSGLPVNATGIIDPDDTDLQKLLSTNMDETDLSLSTNMLDSSGFNDELSREEDELLDGLDTQGLEGLDLDSLGGSLDGLEPLPDLDESQVLPSLEESHDDLPSLDELEASLGDGDETLVEGPEELDDAFMDDSLLLESMDDSLHLDSVADSLRIDGMDQTMDGASGFDAELDDVSDIIDDVDEVETMLDMAQAYLDMGDAESAQHSLKDVLASEKVTEHQKSVAQGLLKKLSSS
ncbi:MAG: FimV/HubP family polar landmark protein [Gammaproteobacteria bacterium]|nr:FimV/HubP family polar landmark protein [Gammaproteobacteria bacterium]